MERAMRFFKQILNADFHEATIGEAGGKRLGEKNVFS